jgi:HlyD family secretion protein
MIRLLMEFYMIAVGKIIQVLRKRKGTILFILLLAVAATAVAAMWEKKSQASDYISVPVERGDIRMSVSATGTVQAITMVQVGSQTSGTIAWLGADFNTRVKQGQVIARLDPATFQSQVDNAQAALQSAEAAVETARKALSEQQASVESAKANSEVSRVQRDDARRVAGRNSELSNVISAREIESALANAEAANARYSQANAQVEQARASAASSKARLDQAAAQVTQAKTQVEQAKIALERTIITSPIDGIVVSRNVDVGQTVAASLQAPTLFTIANDLTKMQVLASIDEADVGRIKEGQKAVFSVDAFPNEQFTGVISQLRLNPTTTQNVVIYSAVIQFTNPEEKLRPGMTANITIPVEERQNVLKVPNAAMRFKPQREDGARGSRGQEGRSEGSRGGGSRAEGGRGEGRPRGGGQSTDNPRSANQNSANQNPPNQDSGNNSAPSANDQPRGNRQTVWVLGQNGNLEPRRIEVGITDGRVSEILSGDLKEGDSIVIGQVESGSARPTQTQGSPFGGRPTGSGRGR